ARSGWRHQRTAAWRGSRPSPTRRPIAPLQTVDLPADHARIVAPSILRPSVDHAAIPHQALADEGRPRAAAIHPGVARGQETRERLAGIGIAVVALPLEDGEAGGALLGVGGPLDQGLPCAPAKLEQAVLARDDGSRLVLGLGQPVATALHVTALAPLGVE